MAEAEDLTPIEQSEGIEDEKEYIEKLRQEFPPEDFALVHELDLLRVVRGYAEEKDRWEETKKHLQLWIDAMRNDFANMGFLPMEDQEMFTNMQGWAGATVHGQDKYGHPVMYEDVANYDCDQVSANLEAALLYRRRVFSQMWNKKHQDSKKTGKVIYKQINVFNLKNIGVMSANKYKGVIQKLIEQEGDLFPETVYKMYFINTSFWFKAAWAVISMFVHPKTKEKIQMLGSDYVKYLEIDVAIDQIPREFGGKSAIPIRWGDTGFDEDAVAQFPDMLKSAAADSSASAEKTEEVVEPADNDAAAAAAEPEKADAKEEVETAPAKVEETAETK